MTPEYETWGQVLQFSLPDRASLATSCESDASLPVRRRPAREPAVEAQVSTDDIEPPADGDLRTLAAGSMRQPADPAERRMIDRQMQAALGRQLRALYDDVASEPVPSRFIELLEALESKEKNR